MSTTSSTVDKISTVVIPVTDQDAMIQFYTDKLGFEKRVDIPFGNQYRHSLLTFVTLCWASVTP